MRRRVCTKKAFYDLNSELSAAWQLGSVALTARSDRRLYWEHFRRDVHNTEEWRQRVAQIGIEYYQFDHIHI